MILNDTANEIVRKAAEEDTPGNNTAYTHKVRVTESALPNGAATEVTLQSVLNAVDGLEGFVDGLEALSTTTNGLLTTIRDNADQIEGFTDGLEALLVSILAAVDGLEGFTDGLEGYTDGVEALLASGNALLTTIRDNADQLEGYLDTVESLLTGPSTSALTPIPASVSTTLILASNATRRGFILYNDSTQPCYVAYAATATTSAFTIRMSANSLYESPIPCYRGDISGIWNVAVGAMRVTELTP